MSSHRTVEPGVPPSVTWSTQLVLPAQPVRGEFHHKYSVYKPSSISSEITISCVVASHQPLITNKSSGINVRNSKEVFK